MGSENSVVFKFCIFFSFTFLFWCGFHWVYKQREGCGFCVVITLVIHV